MSNCTKRCARQRRHFGPCSENVYKTLDQLSAAIEDCSTVKLFDAACHAGDLYKVWLDWFQNDWTIVRLRTEMNIVANWARWYPQGSDILFEAIEIFPHYRASFISVTDYQARCFEETQGIPTRTFVRDGKTLLAHTETTVEQGVVN